MRNARLLFLVLMSVGAVGARSAEVLPAGEKGTDTFSRLRRPEGCFAEKVSVPFSPLLSRVPKTYPAEGLAAKGLKALFYGPTGTGKTTLGLSVPHPVVLDLEAGTDWYKDRFQFSVLQAQSVDEVIQAVEWLRLNSHPYRTLLIDPVTVLWESLQKEWSDVFLKRAQHSSGYRHEYS